MAIVESVASDNGTRTLILRSPMDRREIDRLEVSTPELVHRAVARAREAQVRWGRTPVRERARIVRKAVDVLAARHDEIIATLRLESGKTYLDAMMIDILGSCDFINYWSTLAPRELADERRRTHGYVRPVKKLRIHYRPLGVVAVITPWNGPFSLAVNPVVQALLAGNAVILKPSEVTPRSSEWAVRILHEAGVPHEVLQVLHGDGETGAALVRAGVNKVSFTGSVRTGKKIAAECAEQLIPCTLELGGKDAMIVCHDADLDRASSGAVFNSMMNSGHVCMSIERIYAVDAIADKFEQLVHQKLAALKIGDGDGAEVGSIFWDRQIITIERHIADACAKGARLVTGGQRVNDHQLFFQPTLLCNVDHSMEVMRDETFGPVVCIMRVRDEAEAIARANDSEFGLCASVWTKDNKRGIEIAKQIEAGAITLNDASMAYGITEAPFGGMKNSGLGQVNGPHALRSYAFEQPIVIDRWQLKREHHWYPHSDLTKKIFVNLVKWIFGTKVKSLPMFRG